MSEPITHFREEYYFLSNFYPCRIEYQGIGYKSTEAAYQAQKTENTRLQYEIAAMSAYEAKRAGRELERKKLIRKDWMNIRLVVMNELLKIKFSDPRLQQMLLDTGMAELREENHWGDRYWGVCDGIGQNMLGKLLMLRRKKLILSKMPQLLDEELFHAKL